MKRITQRSAALAVTLVLALAAVATAAPKSERSGNYLQIEGRVLHVNQKTRTLLVSADGSGKLYQVSVPKGETFQITFGLYAKNGESEFREARRNDRVRIRCIRSQEHLARLDDGREVVVLTAAH